MRSASAHPAARAAPSSPLFIEHGRARPPLGDRPPAGEPVAPEERRLHRVPGRGDPLVDAVTPLFAWFGVRPFAWPRPHRHRPDNARLVAMSGLALLVLLPIPYGTALSLDVLWRVHFFSSLLLVPLLVVKLAGTGWRALRYYLGDREYRADGPPHPMPRLTAPILVASTVVLFASGVVMMLGGDRFGAWSTIHNGAAIVFTGALGLHLLAHLWDAPSDVGSDLQLGRAKRTTREVVPGGRRRVVITVAAFVVGVTVATVAMPSAQWMARPAGLHHRDG